MGGANLVWKGVLGATVWHLGKWWWCWWEDAGMVLVDCWEGNAGGMMGRC